LGFFCGFYLIGSRSARGGIKGKKESSCGKSRRAHFQLMALVYVLLSLCAQRKQLLIESVRALSLAMRLQFLQQHFCPLWTHTNSLKNHATFSFLKKKKTQEKNLII